MLIERFEKLKLKPNQVYDHIAQHFFGVKEPLESLHQRGHVVDPVAQPVGLMPNQAKIDAWRQTCTEADLDNFESQLPHTAYLWE